MISKDTFYFSHDYHARHDPKMQKLNMVLGMEGIGIFWCLIEICYEQGGKIRLDECESIAFDMRTHCDRILEVLKNFSLFDFDGTIFSSKAVTERLNSRIDKSEKARKSAEKRWFDASAMPSHNSSHANLCYKGKEIKGNKEIPPISPAGDSLLSGIPPEEEKIESDPTGLFDLFWEIYPRKVGKGAARKAWKKIKEPGLTLEKIEGALAWQKNTEQWGKDHGAYIPHPSTYLNEERWLDGPPGGSAPAPPERSRPMFSTGKP